MFRRIAELAVLSPLLIVLFIMYIPYLAMHALSILVFGKKIQTPLDAWWVKGMKQVSTIAEKLANTN